ncbi:DUF4199 domain-containing protein [Marixanthomonas spongiae]|uniref:DUF4199 domain-containing protein n=1 Tax=Marixanthomonas spongiae TaxID=2174845 RepID=A0A2U0I8H2_9FLAO|nr:DUF4199 domain-containing protein [Marixanthomonas spongiae]PVW17397.1 DUF4199 domain-containing protein [Marixanthomonas spongiae]
MFKIYSRYGVLIAVVLIVYFLLLKLFGLHEYPVLSAANGVIYGAGILLAIKKYKADAGKFDYAKGFEVGFRCGAIATVIFTVFMALYIFELDTEFAQNILDSWNLNFNKGTLILIISIVIMGISTSLVLTLAFMQLLKDSWNTPEGKRNTM